MIRADDSLSYEKKELSVRRWERTEEPLLFVINKSGIRVNRLQEIMDRFAT